MSRALPFYSPTPRRPRRPNHPNLFLLGFSSKLILWLSSFFPKSFLSSQAERAVRVRQDQGRAGQGRAERGPRMGARKNREPRERPGGARAGPGRGQGGAKKKNFGQSLKSARWRLPGARWGRPFEGGPNGQRPG